GAGLRRGGAALGPALEAAQGPAEPAVRAGQAGARVAGAAEVGGGLVVVGEVEGVDSGLVFAIEEDHEEERGDHSLGLSRPPPVRSQMFTPPVPTGVPRGAAGSGAGAGFAALLPAIGGRNIRGPPAPGLTRSCSDP